MVMKNTLKNKVDEENLGLKNSNISNSKISNTPNQELSNGFNQELFKVVNSKDFDNSLIKNCCSTSSTSSSVKTSKKYNIHENHRQRLLDTIFKSGIENVSDVVAMEFILTLIIHRKDVNPLAHELINKFGSLSNVLDADYIALSNIKGLGERSSKLLTLIPKIFYRYKLDKTKYKKSLKNQGEIFDYTESLFLNEQHERVYLICLDKKFNIILTKLLSIGGSTRVIIDPKEFNAVLVNSKADSYILVHNHPNASCRPSEEDLLSTNHLRVITNYLNIRFIDHLIYGEDGLFSIERNSRVRTFFDLEN